MRHDATLQKPFDLSQLIGNVRRKTNIRVTKRDSPGYVRHGTRAAGKTYDKPWHSLQRVDEIHG